MKKLIMALAIALLIAVPAQAQNINWDDIVEKIPVTNQAVVYSLDSNEFGYAITVDVLKFDIWKTAIGIDVGYAFDDRVVALASVKLVELKDYIEIPILEWIAIEPFVYVGVGRIGEGGGNNEFDKGLGCKFLSVDF